MEARRHAESGGRLQASRFNLRSVRVHNEEGRAGARARGAIPSTKVDTNEQEKDRKMKNRNQAGGISIDGKAAAGENTGKESIERRTEHPVRDRV